MKIRKEPFMDLFPVPAVLVTTQCEGVKPNIITIAWTGVLSSGPLVVYISVRSSGRYSYDLIKKSMEYVINIPSVDQAKIVDYCGLVSGKDFDKFAETGLTPLPASVVQAPLIAECPVNLECRVRQIISLGTPHDIFVADVLAVHYNEEVLGPKGKPDLNLIKPISFCANEYRPLTENIGTFGFSNKSI